MNLIELAIKVAVQDGEAQKKLTRLSQVAGKGLASAAKIGVTAMAAAGAAVVGFASKAVSAYAEYEQLVGGVETLFKDAAPAVQAFAENAFQTAGLSANQYMETVTSFSASLLQSLDGDTTRAAQVADMAITDMSENANKMGSDMSSLQAAYQGFAKQNYTMLDNLKLGYGGTKTEMERLLADATELTGIKYDISNLSDVYEAIHAVQTEMGITGTTAKEAATTIQGSIGMLKGAWANLLIGLGRDDADLDKLFDNVVKSAKTAFDNIKPVARRALVGIGKLVGEISPTIAEELPGLMDELLPDLITGAEGLLGGLADALPDLLLTLLDNLPQLVSAAVTIAGKIFNGLKTAIPELLGGIWERIDTALSESEFGDQWQTIKDTVAENVDKIKEKWDELKEKAQPLIDKVGEIKDKFVDWVTSPEFQASVFNAITTAIDDVGTAIGNVMGGIQFILDNAQAAWDALGGGASPAAKAILSAFSPVTSLFSGLAGKISGLFSGLSIPNFGSILGSLLGGQHAIGADYIPYNGYPAILHRGEAVLTAREADEWRRGQGKGSGVVNNFTFNGVSQSDLDYIVAYVNRGLA